MLKLRVITAFGLLGLLLAALFVFSEWQFRVFLALVMTMAAWEWSGLAGFEPLGQRFAYILLLAGGLAASWQLSLNGTLLILSLGALWWLVGLFLVLLYPRGTAAWGRPLILGVAGFGVLLPPWVGLLYLKTLPYAGIQILLLIAFVSCADIAAYFSGRAWGRAKLAPNVSPNKTWEGFFGGVCACCLYTVLVALVVIHFRADLSMPPWYAWLGLLVAVMVLVTVSVVGDLLESMVKRHGGFKDSGKLLPGHGGLLDRLDSLTAVIPVFTLLLILGREFAPWL